MGEINFPVAKLIENGNLDLRNITVPIVLFPTPFTSEGYYQIDNVRYTGIKDGAYPPTGPNEDNGAGNIPNLDYNY